VQCRAGGNLLPDAGDDEHLQGTVLEFEYFLKDKEGKRTNLINICLTLFLFQI